MRRPLPSAIRAQLNSLGTIDAGMAFRDRTDDATATSDDYRGLSRESLLSTCGKLALDPKDPRIAALFYAAFWSRLIIELDREDQAEPS